MAGTRETIVRLVEELRQLDPQHRVFGAAAEGNWGHGYRFKDPLSVQAVAAFESRHGIELPADYRAFITEVGDGGAGPHYGVKSLAEASELSDLSRPFPWASEAQLTSAEIDHADPWPGVLTLSEQGCGYTNFLVVNGKAPSRIWSDLSAGDGPLTPCSESFQTWYLAWARRCISTIEREPLIEEVRLGMTVGELRSIFGDDMKRWEPTTGLINAPDHYIGFENTSASFSMGPDDRVVAVNKTDLI